MNRGTVDLYAVMGVAPTADVTEIRGAYRRLSRVNHPDAGGDERRMMALNRAWAVLRDPVRRHAYDAARTTTTTEKAVEAAEAAPSGPTDPPTRAASPPRPAEPGATILDFGRYAGWSIKQLARTDPDYLLWLERTPAGRPLRREILDAVGR